MYIYSIIFIEYQVTGGYGYDKRKTEYSWIFKYNSQNKTFETVPKNNF